MPQDAEEDAGRPKSWWQTLPGVLTAATGLLTAVAGLIVALHQSGLLDRGHPPAPAAATAEAQSAQAPPPPSPAPAAGPAAGAQAVSFPAGAKVTLGNNRGKGTYELLSAGLERRSAEAGTLTLRIRLTNAGPSDIGFWNDSFRLAVDGVPRAPTSWLNSSVDPRSAKEADIVFPVPLGAKSLTLRINSGDEDGEIPLTLR